MVTNAWPTTWRKSALQAADIEPSPFALKALSLWQKSTPTQPWTGNPLGLPQQGYSSRVVPHTQYALFLKYSQFYEAFARAISTERSGIIKVLLQSGDSVAKLWREIHDMGWPATGTENDYPREIHYWIGDEFRAKLNIQPKTVYRTSGATAQSHINNHLIMQAHRAMITAVQAKLDLASAIQFIHKGVKYNGR